MNAVRPFHRCSHQLLALPAAFRDVFICTRRQRPTFLYYWMTQTLSMCCSTLLMNARTSALSSLLWNREPAQQRASAARDTMDRMACEVQLRPGLLCRAERTPAPSRSASAASTQRRAQPCAQPCAARKRHQRAHLSRLAHPQAPHREAQPKRHRSSRRSLAPRRTSPSPRPALGASGPGSDLSR